MQLPTTELIDWAHVDSTLTTCTHLINSFKVQSKNNNFFIASNNNYVIISTRTEGMAQNKKGKNMNKEEALNHLNAIGFTAKEQSEKGEKIITVKKSDEWIKVCECSELEKMNARKLENKALKRTE